jgi:hypothetical protein
LDEAQAKQLGEPSAHGSAMRLFYLWMIKYVPLPATDLHSLQHLLFPLIMEWGERKEVAESLCKILFRDDNKQVWSSVLRSVKDYERDTKLHIADTVQVLLIAEFFSIKKSLSEWRPVLPVLADWQRQYGWSCVTWSEACHDIRDLCKVIWSRQRDISVTTAPSLRKGPREGPREFPLFGSMSDN